MIHTRAFFLLNGVLNLLLVQASTTSNGAASISSSLTSVTTSTRQAELQEVTTTTTTTTYCNCQYNVPVEAEADCRSYGQLGDGVLIPWYRANQTCLDVYQIKIAAIDRDILLEICPYENATDVDVQLLLNEIRDNPSPATRAIQASHPAFWIESNTTIGTYDLVEVINDGRNNPNCTQSVTLCYSTIREYFTLYPSELGTACLELHARNRLDMDLEQSTVRIRLCQEVDGSSDNILAFCEPLVTQIIEMMSANPSKVCSAFGLGPGTQAVPTGSNCGFTTKDTSTTSSVGRRYDDHYSDRWYGSYHTILFGTITIVITLAHL